MRRLFFNGILADEIEIVGSDAHHIMHVMRGKMGDKVTVVGKNREVALMEMVRFSSDAVALHLLKKFDADTESPLFLTLYQCLLKGEKMDFALQKAVELGVNRIVPVVSQNVVVKFDAKKCRAKRVRWQKIADEAAKQCGRTELVTVEDVMKLRDLLFEKKHAKDFGTLLFCYENEERRSAKKALRELADEKISILIGSEGGFTPEEAESVKAVGAETISLGRRILRAETATMTALAIVQYEKGDLG